MDGQELSARLADIGLQLKKLFSLHGMSWESIQKQAREKAPQAPLPVHHDQRFGVPNKPLAT
jgi:hypothetical protein